MSAHPTDPNSTSPAEWAGAFLAAAKANPESIMHPMTLMAWFHNAIEAGYNCRERNGELDI